VGYSGRRGEKLVTYVCGEEDRGVGVLGGSTVQWRAGGGWVTGIEEHIGEVSAAWSHEQYSKYWTNVPTAHDGGLR